MRENHSPINHFYLSRPPYGGWVLFAVHLLLKRNQKMLFKISKKLESKARDFGYGIAYQNVSKEALSQLNNIFVTSLDKHHYEYVKYMKEPTIVIHDPNEIKPELKEFLLNCKVITIRKKVKKYLKETLDVDSTFKPHPFFPYKLPQKVEKKGAVSTSRVDFDKHTEIIVETNNISKNKVDIYGAVNRIFEYHKLTPLGFSKYYKGRFGKSFNDIAKILNPAKFMVDMTWIKNDGNGTQYTFLEAIHSDCAIVLNRKWLEIEGDFKEGYNCYAVSNAEELKELLDGNIDTSKITGNAKKLLKRHIDVKW